MGMIQSSLNKLFLTSLGAVAGFQRMKPEAPKEEPKQPEGTQDTVESNEATEENVAEMLKEKGVDINNPLIQKQMGKITNQYNMRYDPVESLSQRYENKRGTISSVQNRIDEINRITDPNELVSHSREWGRVGRALQEKRRELAQEQEKGV